jgi:hypothetical protein
MLMLSPIGGQALGSQVTHAVAILGQAAPGGGTFTDFDEPRSDTVGNVLFLGTSKSGTVFTTGLYYFDTSLHKVLRPGDVISGIGTVGPTWDGPALNEPDTVAVVNYGMKSGTTTFDAVIHKAVGGIWTVAAKTGQAVPGCTGGPFTFDSFDDISQNDLNDVTFIASYKDGATPPVFHAGLFVKYSLKPVTAVVCDGDTLGTGEGTLTAPSTYRIDGPAINDAGDVAFQPEIVTGGTARNGSNGVYLKPKGMAIRPLVKEGDLGPSPVGGKIDGISFNEVSLNNDAIGLKVSTQDTSVPPVETLVVAKQDLAVGGALAACARQGQTAPNTGGGTYSDFGNITLADSGTLAFSALVGTKDSVFTCKAGVSQSFALQGDPRPSPPNTVYGALEEASIGGEEFSTDNEVVFIDENPTTFVTNGIYVG